MVPYKLLLLANMSNRSIIVRTEPCHCLLGLYCLLTVLFVGVCVQVRTWRKALHKFDPSMSGKQATQVWMDARVHVCHIQTHRGLGSHSETIAGQEQCQAHHLLMVGLTQGQQVLGNIASA